MVAVQAAGADQRVTLETVTPAELFTNLSVQETISLAQAPVTMPAAVPRASWIQPSNSCSAFDWRNSSASPASPATRRSRCVSTRTKAAQLPAGQGKLCLDSTPDDDPKATPEDWKCDGLGNVLAVKVAWTDNRAATTFVTVVRP